MLSHDCSKCDAHVAPSERRNKRESRAINILLLRSKEQELRLKTEDPRPKNKDPRTKLYFNAVEFAR
jgi:hypothetical protein